MEQKQEIKASKIVAYQEAKTSKLQRKRIKQQSTNEINIKSEYVIGEHLLCQSVIHHLYNQQYWSSEVLSILHFPLPHHTLYFPHLYL